MAVKGAEGMAKKKKQSRIERAKAAQESMNVLKALFSAAARAARDAGPVHPQTLVVTFKETCSKSGIDKRASFLLGMAVMWDVQPVLIKLRSKFRRKPKEYKGQAGQIFQYTYDTISKTLKSKYKRCGSTLEKRQVMAKVVRDTLTKIIKNAQAGKPIAQPQVRMRTM
ncbi:MAG: hypothetical protein S4CHLAM102_13990 [Chlamydiia bacterium]|nr:hypothetical protein [Chlamydiia bacterium]